MSEWSDRQYRAGVMDVTLYCAHGASEGLDVARRKLQVACSQADSPREKRSLLKLARDVESAHERVQATKYRMATRRRAKLLNRAGEVA